MPRANSNFCPAQHPVLACQYRAGRGMANPSPQPTSPQPKAGPAVGVKETTLATKTAFLQHTGSPLACHPDIFAAPCAHTYKIRKFYQAPNGRIDIVILGFYCEINAFHIFLHSEKEIVSRLKKKKRELLQFITLSPHIGLPSSSMPLLSKPPSQKYRKKSYCIATLELRQKGHTSSSSMDK